MSFSSIVVKEYENIYKKIEKRYTKREMLRLSKRKNVKRFICALEDTIRRDVKNRFLLILVYDRLYITYMLTGVLYDWIRITFAGPSKRLNIEYDKTMFTNSKKIYPITKRLRTIQEIEKHFPGFMTFIDCA